MGVPLDRGRAGARCSSWDRDGIDVELPRLGPTRVGLRGRHQAANVAVADAVLDALEAAGIARVDDDGAPARATPRPRGRAGWSCSRPDGRDVLLDGAHNPAGAAALATALDDLRPFLADGPLTLVTASMADKDVDGVVAALARVAGARRRHGSIATAVDLPRAMPAAELAARWARGPARRAGAARRRRTRSRRSSWRSPTATGPVVVAGSLYLVGAVRASLVDDPDLRDPVSATNPLEPRTDDHPARPPPEPDPDPDRTRRPSPGARGRT